MIRSTFVKKLEDVVLIEGNRKDVASTLLVLAIIFFTLHYRKDTCCYAHVSIERAVDMRTQAKLLKSDLRFAS